MDNSFFQIGLIFILATFLGLIIRLLKQPLVLAYILAGIGLGALGMTQSVNHETLALLSQFGIAFLLFMVGLELKLGDLRQIGREALIVGFGQILFTFLAGFLFSTVLGFGVVASLYIAMALTFSSTIIVIKLLSEKNDLDSLRGRISVGILLIQDFVVVLILMVLFSLKEQASVNFLSLFLTLIKGLGFFLLVSLLTKKLIPLLFRLMALSQELLFLTAVAWCFLFASVALLLGFSIEIGAFLAGVSLSSLPYHYQISARIRPLRDLFITLFFVLLGLQVVGTNGFGFLVPALILSGFVLLVKPLVVLVLMGYVGFRKRTSFLTSLSLAQISEFSLILVATGQALGHLSSDDASSVIAVGVITITASTYLVFAGRKIYERFAPVLSVFEKKELNEKRSHLEKPPENHIILIGCNRTGADILELLKKKGDPFLVLDFNPETIRFLEAEGIPCLFGDVSDEEVLEQLNLEKAKIIISTVSDLEDNLVLISKSKIKNSQAPILVTASYAEDEEELYRAGADYVILPHLLGGKHIAHLLSEHASDLEEYLYSKRKKLV